MGSTGLDDGVSMTPVAITRITATILVRDSDLLNNNGLMVNKHQLTPFQAYGAGDPLGYSIPPLTDPKGPWFGLVWPYRDQYDYFNEPTDPLADDIGQPFDNQPGVYGFANISGIARGGPTDPVDLPTDGGPGPGGDPSRLLRGIDGNGGTTGPASFFYFDVSSLNGDPTRDVTVQIIGGFARVVLTDGLGNYSEIEVPVQPYSITFPLPEPASASVLGIAGAAMLVRRRRD